MNDTRRIRFRRLIIVSLVLLLLGGAAGGLYLYRMHRIEAHIRGLKPRGLESLVQEQYPQAIHLLGAYLRRHPNDLEAMRGLAEARANVFSLDGSHIAQLIQIRRRIVELDPTDDGSWRDLMQNYLKAGYHTEAIETADRLLAKDDNDRAALKVRARAKAALREFEAAHGAAARYCALVPEDLEIQILTLRLMAAMGQEPIEILSRARTLQAEYPDDYRFVILVGYAHQITGERDAAAKLYRRAAAMGPTRAADIDRLSVLMDQAGLTDEATKLLRSAEGASSNPRVGRLLARRLWEQGRHGALLDWAKRIDLELATADSEALAIVALARLKRDADGFTAILKQLETRKRDGLAQSWALLLRTLSDDTPTGERLVAATEAALGYHPEHPYFHYFRGAGLAQTGKVEQALEAWQASARYAPSWPTPLLRMAHVLETINPAMAVDVARSAVRRAPSNPEAVVTFLETVAMQIDELDEARLSQLTKTTETLLSQVPPAERRLLPLVVDLRVRRGDPAAARATIEDALATTPPLAPRMLLRLAYISRRHNLDLAEACLSAYETAWGIDARLAYANAMLVGDGRDAAKAVQTFDTLREQTSADADPIAWRLARARLLEAHGAPETIDAWRGLLDDHSDERRVLEAANRSATLWRDRELAGRLVAALGRTRGEQSTTWRVARARWLLELADAEPREIAEASTFLIEATRRSPYRVQPPLLLSQCFERMGNPSRALDYLNQAQRLKPTSAAIALNRARLMRMLGEDEAAAQIQAMLARRDDLAVPQRLQLAALMSRRNDIDGATAQLDAVLQRDPDNRRALLLQASLLMQAGEADRAEAIYERLLEQPEASTIEMASIFYESKGELDRARRLLARLDEIDVEPEIRALIRAGFHERREELDAAERVLADVATPDASVRLWRALITLNLRRGRLSEALEDVDRAAAAHPGDAGFAAVAARGKTLRALEKRPNLLRLVTFALEDPEVQTPVFRTLELLAEAENRRDLDNVLLEVRQIADHHRRFLPLQTLVVQMYQSMGRHSDAAELASRTMRAFPEASEPAWMAAEALAATGRWSEALTVAREWRQRTQYRPLAADLMIAEAQLQLGQGNAAREHLRTYAGNTRTPEEEFLVLRANARALIQEGELEEARSLIKPRLADSQRHRLLHMSLAVLALPDAAAAEAWLTDVAKALPKEAPEELVALARSWRAIDERFQVARNTEQAVTILDELSRREDAPASAIETLAMIRERDGDLQAAEDGYRRALRLNPEMPVSLNNLAMIELRRGDGEAALTMAERAVDLAPRSAAFQDTLALALIQTGRTSEGLAAAHRAVSLNPRNLEFYLTLGEAMVAAEQADEAKQMIERLEEAGLDASGLPDALRSRLNNLRRELLSAADAGAPVTGRR